MSLETAGFIKDLVPTNPEGTDPKSQGDDHLRMIKAVLKAQFPGFTDGIGITLTETNLNGLGGSGFDDPAFNFDLPTWPTRFFGLNTGCTGTFPPGGAAGAGEMLLNISYSSSRVYQLYFRSSLVYARIYIGGAFQPWVSLTSIGAAQSWTEQTANRAIGTTYTNDTGRPIMIAINMFGVTGAARGTATLTVQSQNVYTATLNDQNTSGSTYAAIAGTLNAIVPPGATYVVNTSGAASTVTNWKELR